MKHRHAITPFIILLITITFTMIPLTAKAESYSISGIITAESYGAPEEAWVDVYDADLNYIKRGNYDSITGGYYVSIGQSNYYLLYFSNFPFRIPEFYSNSENNTTWIFNPSYNNLVNINQNKTQNLTLKLGSFVTGTIRNSNGDPISGAAVEFYADDGSGFKKSMFEFSSDSNGYFRAWALPSNQQLKIRVRSNSEIYDSLWYGSADSIEDAAVLTVGSGMSLSIVLPDTQPSQENGSTNNDVTQVPQNTSQNLQSSSELEVQCIGGNRYLATANPTDTVSKVYFYLDGKLKKIDKKAPFNCKLKIPSGNHIIKVIYFSSDKKNIQTVENLITQ